MHLIRHQSQETIHNAILRLVFIALTLSVRLGTAALSATDATSQYLHLTALISDHDGRAFFECWEIATPFSRYPTVGEAIPGLADVSNVSYVVLPPRSNEGFHKPPHPMFFVLLAGLAHVTLPEGKEDLWIKAGSNEFMIAADTVGDGHITEYPSDEKSIALQIPFTNGVLPAHTVTKNGTCEQDTAPFIGSKDQDDWPSTQKAMKKQRA